jgi:hypothetical protein
MLEGLSVSRGALGLCLATDRFGRRRRKSGGKTGEPDRDPPIGGLAVGGQGDHLQTPDALATGAVPALAALLTDEQLAAWARIALEAIPDPAADQALREAAARSWRAGCWSASSTRSACGAMRRQSPCWPRN